MHQLAFPTSSSVDILTRRSTSLLFIVYHVTGCVMEITTAVTTQTSAWMFVTYIAQVRTMSCS